MKEYNILNNGYKIPNKGFGTYKMKGTECINAVIEAVKKGYRHIDTAQAYENEEDIGIAISKLIEENIIKREDLFITSKINPHNPIGYKEAIQAINDSIEKMKIGYIDCYLIHWPNLTPDDKWKRLNAETWRGFEKMYELGKVKVLGVSNFMIHHMEELFKTATIKPAINQLNLNPTWQQKEVVAFCKKNNIQCVAWESLVKIEKWNQLLMNSLANKYNRSTAQISLKWSMQKGFIPLAKSRNKHRIAENYNIDDFKLSNDDISKLDTLNNHPANWDASPDTVAHTWMLYEELSKTPSVLIKEEVKLLGIIPIIKTQYNNNTSKHYLFGIFPFFKKKIKTNKAKYYFLGIHVASSNLEYIPSRKTIQMVHKYTDEVN